MKAAGAWREARWMFRPPRELGREAFSQAHCDRGHPARSDKASNMVSSNASVAALMCMVRWTGA